jgi:hypothetical protein
MSFSGTLERCNQTNNFQNNSPSCYFGPIAFLPGPSSPISGMGQRAEAASCSSRFVLPRLASIRQEPSLLRVVAVIFGFSRGSLRDFCRDRDRVPPIREREIFYGLKRGGLGEPVIRGLNDFPCFFC